MAVLDHPDFDDHEQVVFCCNSRCGLHAIIAIHDTRLGQALGGCRMWAYGSEDEALMDALRLSRAMTYKAALAGLQLGGGKSVIIGDPETAKSEELLHAMGAFVDSLGGRYIVAEDVGVAEADIETMGERTRHIAGTRSSGGDDPSPATAFGVLQGMKAAVAHKLGRDSLRGLTVAVQGLGAVGSHLCRLLAGEGAHLIVSDIRPEKARIIGEECTARVVEPDRIHTVPADIFAPCALGGVLNEETIARLQAGIVVGSANNQLESARHAERLAERGILYAPDYVVNAGGIISISHAGANYRPDRARAHVARIRETLGEIFVRAEREHISTAAVADRFARERLAAVRPSGSIAAA